MTQVLHHDYGKSKVTLLEIRSAIKAVKTAKAEQAVSGSKSRPKVAKSPGSKRSRKGA